MRIQQGVFAGLIAVAAIACTTSSAGEPAERGLKEERGCQGLLNALANCPNDHACAVIQGLLDAHGCTPPAPACPCAEAPFPVGQIYCGGVGNPVTGVFCCWTIDPNHCEVFGADYSPEEQQAICDACRVAYPDEYAGCVAAGG